MGYLFRCFRTSLRSALAGLSRLVGRLVVAGERYVFPEARHMSHFETHARWCIVVADAAGPKRYAGVEAREARCRQKRLVVIEITIGSMKPDSSMV